MKNAVIIFFLLLSILGGLNAQEVKYFQVDSVKNITGEIIEIKTEKCYQNDFIVLYIKEKTGGEVYRVEAAPGWFFDLDILAGSKVEVAGSYSKIDEKNMIIAQSITYQGAIYEFRDKYGFPLWRGKGMHKNRGQQGKGKAKKRGHH